MFLELETPFINLFVEFFYAPGSKDTFDEAHGNWLPGDPPDVKLIHVWIGSSNGRIDILKNISSSERSAIEDYCIENAEA